MTENKAPNLKEAFLEYNRETRIANSRVGCTLAVVLMPAGSLLDYFVYPEQLGFFFLLRVICSVLAFIVWLLLGVDFGRRHYRFLGMAWFILPSLFISLMIYFSEGIASPYYAGLTLVLIAISWVAQVQFSEALVAVILTLIMYSAACWGNGARSGMLLFNNYYFIILNGIVVVVGSYLISRLRFREYSLRVEVDQNRKDLEASNLKLIELDRAKTDFFANISHELRTPLTLLVGPLDKLRNPNFPPTGEEKNELLDIMYNNAMRLLRLINDLLNLVKLDSGTLKLNTEKTELRSFLEGLAHSAQPMAMERHLNFDKQIDVEPDFSCFLDRDKTEKIVLNLLFNAFKFTPSNGRVFLKAALAGQFLEIEVHDTGKGIAKEELPRIFDRFWQAEAAATRRYQGVGIGLALVRELSQLHGGGASVESTPGVGTIMRIRLNLSLKPREYAVEPGMTETLEPSGEEWLTKLYRRAELFPSHVMKGAPGGHPNAVESGETTAPVVLIADDEPEMRRFLRSQLKALFTVHEAVDGTEALNLAETNDYSLILVDYMMPGIDGMEVVKKLRSQVRTQSVPVIMLTARADDESKMKALELGATDFLTKPFASTELMVRSRNLVSAHQMKQVLEEKTRKLEEALELIKQTETQLVQQAKMATLGQLSAGLMHEINNPLNFANTAFHLLKKRIVQIQGGDQEKLAKPLNDIQDGIKRVADIITGLRGFSHPNETGFDVVGVKSALDTAIRFVRIDPADIFLQTDVGDDLKVWGNTNQLIQLFVNLLQNAVDSLKEKGGDNHEIRITGALKNEEITLQFHDNGTGISPSGLTKIFDAFYTTKEGGSGVGLGLSICQRIAKHHKGRLEVESEEGKYCRFNLTLPQYESDIKTL